MKIAIGAELHDARRSSCGRVAEHDLLRDVVVLRLQAQRGRQRAQPIGRALLILVQLGEQHMRLDARRIEVHGAPKVGLGGGQALAAHLGEAEPHAHVIAVVRRAWATSSRPSNAATAASASRRASAISPARNNVSAWSSGGGCGTARALSSALRAPSRSPARSAPRPVAAHSPAVVGLAAGLRPCRAAPAAPWGCRRGEILLVVARESLRQLGAEFLVQRVAGHAGHPLQHRGLALAAAERRQRVANRREAEAPLEKIDGERRMRVRAGRVLDVRAVMNAFDSDSSGGSSPRRDAR